MPLTADELLQRLRQNRPPFADLLGADIVALDTEAGTARMTFNGKPELCNPMGVVQGGFVAAMLDYVMTMAAFAAANQRVEMPTLEMKINFLGPVFPGTHRGEGVVTRKGRSIMFLEGRLYNGKDQLVVTASSTAKPIYDPQRFRGPGDTV